MGYLDLALVTSLATTALALLLLAREVVRWMAGRLGGTRHGLVTSLALLLASQGFVDTAAGQLNHDLLPITRIGTAFARGALLTVTLYLLLRHPEEN